MKHAPKSVFIAVLFCFILFSCLEHPEKEQKPKIEDGIDKPEIIKKDSIERGNQDKPSFPDASHPRRTKERSGDDLDTLKAIKV